MKPYEYLVIVNPTENEKKDGKRPYLVEDRPKVVLAKDENHARTIAVASLDRTIVTDEMLDRVEVTVRPFRG